MQENIQRSIKWVTADKKILFGILFGVIVMVIGFAVVSASVKNSSDPATEEVGNSPISDIEIAVAGATSSADISGVENSWPGELISLGSIPIQPAREGTISSWNVHVGQRVAAGEVLGMLSVPPAMPDTIAMLADEQKMVSMARASVDAKRVYAKVRIAQIDELRENTLRSLDASRALLGGSMSMLQVSGGSNFSMIEAKKQTLRAMLRGTLATTYPMLSGNGTLPARWTAVALKDAIGAQNVRLRDAFPSVLFATLSDIDTPDKLPLVSGLAYFELTIKLADASIPDGSMLTDLELMNLKAMLHRDQESFIMAADKLRETELMAVDTEKTSFEQVRMNDNDIAMLRQDLAMAEGDLAAKEAAYQTVKNGVLGNAAIVAPKGGTVSSIMRKVGEFVGPGMPVAVVTGGQSSDYIVRFRIPSNIRKPEIGQEFYVTRSGFPQMMPRAKLIGVGNSLDDTGSIMADALLLEPVDWPIGVSLRVVTGVDTETLEIPLSSIWWDAGASPNVWAVSLGGRLYAKKVSLGRTLGDKIEVYGGLSRGEQYIVKSVPGIAEDMLLDDIKAPDSGQKGESSYDAAMRAMGM